MTEPRHRRPYALRARLNDGPSDHQGRHVLPDEEVAWRGFFDGVMADQKANPLDAICTHPEPKAVS